MLIHLLATAALVLVACDDAGLTRPGIGGQVRDAGVGSPHARDAGAHAFFDSSVGPDAQFVPSYGQRIATVPARVVAVTPDESEILYLAGDGTLTAVSPQGGLQKSITQRASVLYPPNPIMWMFLERPDHALSAAVGARHPQTSTVTTVVAEAAFRVLFVSPDSENAITTEAVHTELGPSRTTTQTSSLIAVSATGERRTLVERVNLGVWDDVRSRFSGQCRINAVWTSTNTALVTACVNEGDGRALVAVNTQTASTATLAADVLSFLVADPDGDFVLFADAEVHLYGTDGERVVALDESEPFTDVEVLGGGRFAYTNASGALRVASWPAMRPSTVHPFGARQLRGRSPTGEHVLFSQTTQAASDLFLASTSTAAMTEPLVLSSHPDAVPGDDPFSADGNFVYWYANPDAEGLLDVFSMPTDGSQAAAMLGERGFFVRNYAAGDSVMMMVNARQAMLGQSQLVLADLAVRRRDGTGALLTLVPGVHATDYAILPSGGQVVYHVPDGQFAGLWVRDL